MAGGVLREILARFGFDVDDKKLDGADKKLDNLKDKVEKFVKAAGLAFAGVETFRFADEMAKQADETDDAAVALGTTAAAVQAYGLAANEAGDDANLLIESLGRLQQRANDPTTQKAFRKLGVSVKDSNGEMKSADQLFRDAADGLSKIQDPTKRAGLAVELFGKSGRKMLPILSQGSAGLLAMRDELEQLGGGISEATIAVGADFQKSMARLGVVTLSLKDRLAQALIPILTRVVDGAIRVGSAFLKMVSASNVVKSALFVLGGVLAAFALRAAVAMLPALAPFLLWGAIIGGIVLLVDELWTTFEGGDSIIRRVVDGLFGVGATAHAVEELKDIWQALAGWIKTAWQYLQKFSDIGNDAIKNSVNAVNNALGGEKDQFTKRQGETTGFYLRRLAGTAGVPQSGIQASDFAGKGLDLSQIYGSRRVVGAGAAPGGRSGPAMVTNHVTVHAGSADAKETARLVDERLQKANRDAVHSLVQVAEPESED